MLPECVKFAVLDIFHDSTGICECDWQLHASELWNRLSPRHTYSAPLTSSIVYVYILENTHL
jgi:hypothetical protein